jgi:hypothetical protein
MIPRVSIIIPLFNARNYIAETLASASGQTWPEIEIIVVDDGSTDGSLDIALKHEGGRVRVLRQQNRGSCAARNAGLRAASGNYLQFLDHDDILAPDKIERQLCQWTQAVSRLTLFMGELARFITTANGARLYRGSDGRYHSEYPVAYPTWHDAAAFDWLLEWWNDRRETTPLPWLISRELAELAGPWDEGGVSRLDDFEYLTRVLLAADRIVFTPRSRAGFRTLVTGSLSSTAMGRTRSACQEQSRALGLCCDHLLARADTPATRRTCGALLMHFAFETYPYCRGAALAAEQRARQFDVPLPPCPGGRIVRALTPLTGWKFARQLQYLACACGYRRH